MENQKRYHTQKGYWIACGVARKVGELILIGLLFVVAINSARYLFEWGKDDTDPAGKARSGLHLYTDAKTGVQYLGDGKGGLTPRLDADGSILISH